jgi:hypothetical protein
MAEYRAETWTDPRQSIRPSAIAGHGIFASAPIGCGEAVEIIGGTPMSEAQFRAFQAVTPVYNAVQIGENLHLVERLEATARRAGSINHSCDANLWLADEVTVVARRAIAAGEELTIDYALFTSQPDWALDGPCRCGSPLCRGTIRGDDWQIPAVQDRYYAHFMPFINERIARRRGSEAQPG